MDEEGPTIYSLISISSLRNSADRRGRRQRRGD